MGNDNNVASKRIPRRGLHLRHHLKKYLGDYYVLKCNPIDFVPVRMPSNRRLPWVQKSGLYGSGETGKHDSTSDNNNNDDNCENNEKNNNNNSDKTDNNN